jgi:hypothetical protein
MRIKEHIMKSTNIGQINQALVIMRHFIDLSAKLLPFLDEINKTQNPSTTDLKDRDKIIKVYTSYEFDDVSSKTLMDSDILSLIKVAYERLINKQSANQSLHAFDLEFSRLRKDWNKISAN